MVAQTSNNIIPVCFAWRCFMGLERRQWILALGKKNWTEKGNICFWKTCFIKMTSFYFDIFWYFDNLIFFFFTLSVLFQLFVFSFNSATVLEMSALRGRTKWMWFIYISAYSWETYCGSEVSTPKAQTKLWHEHILFCLLIKERESEGRQWMRMRIIFICWITFLSDCIFLFCYLQDKCRLYVRGVYVCMRPCRAVTVLNTHCKGQQVAMTSQGCQLSRSTTSYCPSWVRMPQHWVEIAPIFPHTNPSKQQ